MIFNQSYTVRTSTTDKYFSDIKKYKLLSREAEAEVIARCKAGDEKARVELVSANLRFVVSVAKNYQGRSISIDDLISAGNLGMLRAVDKFDPSTGNKFISYAVWYIRSAISDEMRSNGTPIRVPQNVLAANFKSMRETGVAVHDLSSLRTVSYDAAIRDGNTTMLDMLASSAFAAPGENIDAHPIHRCVAMLKPIYREIISMKHGFTDDKPMSFAEIANKIEGDYSPEKIRQIYTGAIWKLKRLMVTATDKEIKEIVKQRYENQ